MRIIYIRLLAAVFAIAWPTLPAQTNPSQARDSTVPPSALPSPPTTKLEAFALAKGTLIISGATELGSISKAGKQICRGDISIASRELRHSDGGVARGIEVTITEGGGLTIKSSATVLIDLDELPDLVKGIDVLLSTKESPTGFEKFTVSYTTAGGLRISGAKGYVLDVVQKACLLNDTGLQELKALIQQALNQLTAK
jgi:hypothetical protein